jgi:hypothetical protein
MEPTSLRGRRAVLSRIRRLHESPARPHLSVVAPRGMGKSELLRAVVSANRRGSSAFSGAALVDLRTSRPGSVAEMVSLVGTAIRDALLDARDGSLGWMADLIDPTAAPQEVMDQLVAALETLTSENERMLLALDGCDPVLQNPHVPVHLWESLRSLAQSPALRLMTASRRSLVELCSNPDARVSPFFNIFGDAPIHLPPFQEEDWEDIADAYAGRLDGAAVKEIKNWSGGRPDLVAALLDHVLNEAGDAAAGKPEVDAKAAAMARGGSHALEALWRDCPDAVRGDVVRLVSSDEAITDGDRRGFLIDNGIAAPSGGKLRLTNGLMKELARSRGSDVTDVRRLFDGADAFSSNVRSVLELRLAAVPGGDPELRRLASRSFGEVPDDPSGCLGRARDIAERALALIWAAEAPDGKVPEKWIEVWKHAGRQLDWLPSNRRLPSLDKRGDHCTILRLATGNDRVDPVVARLTKASFILLEHVVNVGNHRNHRDNIGGPGASLGMAVAFCFAVIELIESLARDLEPRRSGAT